MSTVHLHDADALLIVDVQHDFLPGGALGIEGADAIIPVLDGYIRLFASRGLPVFATRDWHPPDHCSFTDHGGEWPPHCIAGSHGAEFPAELPLDGATIVSKATQADADAYSGFDGTDLHEQLQRLGVQRLFIGGLATDYCVRATVLDALKLGYRVLLLADAVRAVNLNPDDGAQALAAMRRAGAETTRLEDCTDR